jgi:hypothetical protein
VSAKEHGAPTTVYLIFRKLLWPTTFPPILFGSFTLGFALSFPQEGHYLTQLFLGHGLTGAARWLSGAPGTEGVSSVSFGSNDVMTFIFGARLRVFCVANVDEQFQALFNPKLRVIL